MRKHTLSTIVITLSTLIAAGCASKPKEEVPAAAQPAVAPVPGPGTAPTPGVPAVGKDGVSSFACEKGKDKRTLDIRTKDKGCEAVYIKGGQGAVVGTGKKGSAHCEATIKKIKQKLVAGGYTCQ